MLGERGNLRCSGPILHAAGVDKRYGGVRALRDASLSVAAGEIHGLVGENGSGKSTLLRILSGQTLPDRADIHICGERLPLGDPPRSLASGIATVTQETTLVPDLTIAENILLGRRMVRRWYGVDWPATTARAREVLARLDLDLDPHLTVRRLRPDERQMVELARAISMNVRLLILDEPTSALTDEEVEALFAVTRTLRAEGVSTIFVSHRMREVLELTDRITVLRDGVTVATRETPEVDHESLIELMVGAKPESAPASPRATRAGAERPLLRVEGLGVPGFVRDATFEVGRGEIVGLAGLVGAGRSELLGALFGLHPRIEGRVLFDGRPIAPQDPADAIRHRIGYVPGDRKLAGLVLGMTTRENLMMSCTAQAARLRRPSRRDEARRVQAAIDDYKIRGMAANGAPVAALSGGNQQKVVLAKWMAINPSLLLLDEPTKGVDVGAKAEIYRLLQTIGSQDLGVLVSSSEVPELLLLCDRILVMFRGRIVASLSRAEASEARIAQFATGHDAAAEVASR